MNWLHGLWFGYFWPSDKGNGPEALTQTVVYAAVGIYFIPKVRAWVNGHMAAIHKKLDTHHQEHLELVKQHHAEQIELAKAHHAEILKVTKPRTVRTPKER